MKVQTSCFGATFPSDFFTNEKGNLMIRISLARKATRHLLCSGIALLAAFNILAAPTPSATVVPSQAVAKPSTDSAGGWRKSLELYAQVKETCFSKGEKTDGMNKICFYSCPSGEAAITVSAVSLCPLSIQK